MNQEDRPKATPSDEALVLLARKGDHRAFEDLTRRYERSVYGIAWSITGRKEDAQDVCQDAFVRAFLRLEDPAEPSKFSGWIGRIVRNASYDALALRKRNRVDQDWLRERDLATATTPDFDEALRLQRLGQAIRHLQAARSRRRCAAPPHRDGPE